MKTGVGVPSYNETQERFIVPGLGIVILLSAFLLGVPLVYKLLMGLLGLATAGTYFAPHKVQVETRIAIAALGLIILLLVTSTAFWLTLLSFGAIAALQYQYRHTLQRKPATIAWLRTVVEAAQARRVGRADGGGDADEEAGAGAGDDESRPRAPSAAGALPGFVRINVAGVGGPFMGALVILSVFMPWYGFLVSAFGEMAGGDNLTLIAAAEEMDLAALRAFFFVLLALGVSSIISIALPRAVAAIIAGLGFTVTLASYLYMVAEVERAAGELSNIGAGVTTIPAIGALLAGACFLVMLVLQLIPGANRSR